MVAPTAGRQGPHLIQGNRHTASFGDIQCQLGWARTDAGCATASTVPEPSRSTVPSLVILSRRLHPPVAERWAILQRRTTTTKRAGRGCCLRNTSKGGLPKTLGCCCPPDSMVYWHRPAQGGRRIELVDPTALVKATAACAKIQGIIQALAWFCHLPGSRASGHACPSRARPARSLQPQSQKPLSAPEPGIASSTPALA